MLLVCCSKSFRQASGYLLTDWIPMSICAAFNVGKHDACDVCIATTLTPLQLHKLHKLHEQLNFSCSRPSPSRTHICPPCLKPSSAGLDSQGSSSRDPSMSDEDFLERLHSLRADAPDYGETSRAENTHGEFLRRLKDWEALSKLDEGTVLHIWRRSERCEDCELCSFLESEVDRVGLFGAQVWQIWYV